MKKIPGLCLICTCRPIFGSCPFLEECVHLHDKKELQQHREKAAKTKEVSHPLTLSELEEMDGEPVCLEKNGKHLWDIILKDSNGNWIFAIIQMVHGDKYNEIVVQSIKDGVLVAYDRTACIELFLKGVEH